MSRFEDIIWNQNQDPKMQHVRETLAYLDKSQWNSQDEVDSNLTDALKQISDYCYQHVPFYKHRMEFLQDSSFDLKLFSQIPILTKADIRTHTKELISDEFDVNHSNIFKFSTSGSTGTPMSVYRGQRNLLFTRALTLRYHLWHNRDFQLKNASIITVKRKLDGKAGNWASHVKTGPGYTVDISSDSKDIFTKLQEINPNYIQTHPSTLKRLIDISLEKNQSLDELKEVRCFGEVFEPQIRKACKDLWGVAASDNYSCEEMGPMAFQCPENDHYHVQIEGNYIEVVDAEGKICPPGKQGRLLVTQLKNLAMPLIRYELGDMASMGESCSCGRKLPIIKNLAGRVRNLVKLPNGDTFHPVFDEDEFLAVLPIKQYQFIQKTLDTIEVTIACDEALTPTKEALLGQAFNKSFKHSFNYKFNIVNKIPLSARNKFELFKCELE